MPLKDLFDDVDDDSNNEKLGYVRPKDPTTSISKAKQQKEGKGEQVILALPASAFRRRGTTYEQWHSPCGIALLDDGENPRLVAYDSKKEVFLHQTIKPSLACFAGQDARVFVGDEWLFSLQDNESKSSLVFTIMSLNTRTLNQHGTREMPPNNHVRVSSCEPEGDFVRAGDTILLDITEWSTFTRTSSTLPKETEGKKILSATTPVLVTQGGELLGSNQGLSHFQPDLSALLLECRVGEACFGCVRDISSGQWCLLLLRVVDRPAPTLPTPTKPQTLEQQEESEGELRGQVLGLEEVELRGQTLGLEEEPRGQTLGLEQTLGPMASAVHESNHDNEDVVVCDDEKEGVELMNSIQKLILSKQNLQRRVKELEAQVKLQENNSMRLLEQVLTQQRRMEQNLTCLMSRQETAHEKKKSDGDTQKERMVGLHEVELAMESVFHSINFEEQANRHVSSDELSTFLIKCFRRVKATLKSS